MAAAGAGRRVAVIGGGVTGLSAAYQLGSLAAVRNLPLTVTLFEASDRLGGKILTHSRDGLVIEGGPDSFISQKPWGVELCRRLGLGADLTGTNPDATATYLLTGNRLVPLPEGWMLLVPTRIWPFVRSPLFSWSAKLRMAMEPFVRSRNVPADESLAGFVERRLGSEAAEKLAGPLLAGIYAGDAGKMSLAATFPQLSDLVTKHGSLLRGMIAMKRARSRRPAGGGGSNLTMFVTLRGGLNQLVRALKEQIQGEIRTGVAIKGITPEAGGYRLILGDGGTFTADAVILASPASGASDLIAGFDPELAATLREIRYSSTATVTMAFPRAAVRHPLNGFGFVVAPNESRRILACTWTSSKFPHRAPRETVLIRCFLGGMRDETVGTQSDSELSEAVFRDLDGILGGLPRPIVTEIFRWERANPQYEIGHLDRLRRIDARLDHHPGLYLAGAAYRGVGIPDCIHQGMGAADQAAALLFETNNPAEHE